MCIRRSSKAKSKRSIRIMPSCRDQSLMVTWDQPLLDTANCTFLLSLNRRPLKNEELQWWRFLMTAIPSQFTEKNSQSSAKKIKSFLLKCSDLLYCWTKGSHFTRTEPKKYDNLASQLYIHWLQLFQSPSLSLHCYYQDSLTSLFSANSNHLPSNWYVASHFTSMQVSREWYHV